MPSYTLPLDANSRPASGGYTPAIGVITLQTGTPTTDGLGVTSAPLNVVLVPDSGTYQEQSALSAGYQGAYLVPMTDVSAFKWLSLHITGGYNGTLAFQVSNNGQDWDSYPMSQQSIPGVLLSTVTNLTGIFGGPVIARYFQVQMVNYGTGIATGTLEQYVVPPALPTAIAPSGIKVDGSGVTQPVVGVVTINTSNQSPIPISGNITTSDASVGTIGVTAPVSASLVGASDGTNLQGLLVDGSGNLKVNVAAGGGAGGTSSSFSATFPATGTAVGASDGTNMKALLVDGSGYLKVNVAAGGASGGTSSSFSSAFPATGTAVGASDGTNMKALLVDGSGYLKVNVAAGGGAGGTSLADDAAFTAGTTSLTPSGGVYNDAIASATSGHADAVRITAKRAFHTNLRDSSGNELLGSKTSATSVPVVIASDQGAVTISGTVTANMGTTNGLALDTSVNGLLLSQGSTTSGQKGPLLLGAVTTNAPSYTTAQSSPLSLDPSGLLRVSLKDTPANTTNLNVALAAASATVTVSGTVTANAGTGPFPVAGMVASGASNANNPIKVGGVYNSTQPTVTTGQIVDGQYSARGAQIVATGADTFNVTVNAALPTGSNTIGAVTQASGPWSQNITQISGSSISTAATGVQKVGLVGNTGATVDASVGAGTAPTNAVITGALYNASAPAPTTGQAMALQTDQAGNLRAFPGIALSTLSAWSSATSLNATQTIFTNSGAVAVLVQLTQTTTITAGAITYEVSYDGSTWSTIPANCVLDPTSTTFAGLSLPYTLQASTNKLFLLNMNGAQGLRIKLSTQITGTGTVTPNYALLPASPADTVVAYSPTAANFNVTVGGSLPTGANTIGAVTQASGPWTSNVTQIGGTNVVTGGASGLLAVGGPVASGSSNADNPLKIGGVFTTTQPTVTTGQIVDAQMTARGAQIVATGTDTFNVTVNAALPTGSNTIGALSANQSVNMAQVAGTTADTNSGTKSAGTLRVVLATDQPTLSNALAVSQSGTWTVQPGNTANTTPWLVSPQVATSGGSTPYHLISAASTNANNVKSTAGNLYGYTLSNTNASARFFRLYNLSGSPTVGTSTIKHTVQIPGNATVIHVFPNGFAFGTGIALACTGAMGDSDTTAIGAGDVSIDLDYD